ncbi:MAG: 50S ribosomal protein L11, partial [Nitrospirota bacterium]
ASDLLKKAAGIIKGSSISGKEKVGKVTAAQIKEIAQRKLPDLNAYAVDKAEQIIRGTARSMGIEIIE